MATAVSDATVLPETQQQMPDNQDKNKDTTDTADVLTDVEVAEQEATDTASPEVSPKTPDASETASPEASPQTTEGDTAAPPAKDTEKTARPVGYTGEIIGDVVKLEDLVSEEESLQTTKGHDELMALVESTLTNVSAHEIVTGRVVSIGEKDVVVDIGFKSDGIVSRSEWTRELKPGDEVEVYLERIEDYQGQLVLSKSKADKVKRWQRIEDAFEQEKVLEGTIVRRIKGGMIVELFDGIEAFLPGSQIDVRPVRDFDAYLEKKMEFKIVKLNPANENIVVSHKALIEKDLEAQRDKILSTMEPGQILEGVVKNITDFGVFIDLGGVDGLLHITDLSWGRVSHPSELVNLDEKLNIVVLDYDKERQRISLGLKQLQPHPWDNISERYSEGDTVEGKVVSITDYGAFVELEKGIDGLVHISDLSWTKKIRHPSEVVKKGQELDVVVLNIDGDDRRISLGHKQVETNPWSKFSEVYQEGSSTEGTVVRVEDKGVIVNLPLDVEAFLPAGELKGGAASLTTDYPEGAKLEKLTVLRCDPSQKEILLSEVATEREAKKAARTEEKKRERAEKASEREAVRTYQKKASSTGPTTLGELSGLGALKKKMQAAEDEAQKAEVEAQKSAPEDEDAVESGEEEGQEAAEEKPKKKRTRSKK